MKTRIALVSALTIPVLLFLGCSASTPEPTPTPAPAPAPAPTPQAVTIEVSCDDFAANKHMTKDVQVNVNDSIVLSLCSNASTGYQWGEQAEIGDASVVSQYEHHFVAPQTEQNGVTQMLVGAPGKDVWTFKPLKAGTTTITLRYNRPWEATAEGEWSYTMNVTVVQ